MKRFRADITLTFQTVVSVDAESKEEAIEKLKDCGWDDDGLAGADLSDWSDPRNVREE